MRKWLGTEQFLTVIDQALVSDLPNSKSSLKNTGGNAQNCLCFVIRKQKILILYQTIYRKKNYCISVQESLKNMNIFMGSI